MRKLREILTALLLFTLISAPAIADTENTLNEPKKTADAIRAEVLLKRLDEIKALDKSEMTRPERRKLRKEVRTIKRELKDLGGGIYISVGALIIIILLLIILL